MRSSTPGTSNSKLLPIRQMSLTRLSGNGRYWRTKQRSKNFARNSRRVAKKTNLGSEVCLMAEQPVVPPRGPSGGAGDSHASGAPESKRSDSGVKGASNVTPLEGKTTIDEKMSIECEILCYQAISKIAGAIAHQFHHLVSNCS